MAVSVGKPRTSFYLLALATIVILWIAATPKEGKAPRGEARTQVELEEAKRYIEQFIAEWKETPANLVELRAFAKDQNLDFSSYDAYGQALQYVRLGPTHFALRSFGADGQQNTTTTAPDPSIVRWAPLPKSTPLYRYQTEPTLSLYPTPLILGSNSPNLKWHAEIFLDRNAGTRQLLVRSRSNDGLFLVAPHDLIEEFLWLPGSDQIVYTATGSLRYKDGLFLWNLEKNETIDLTQAFAQGEKPAELAGESNLYLSLAGINLRGQQVFAYIAARESAELNPADFFSARHFYAISIPRDKAPAKIAVAFEEKATTSALDGKFHVMDHIFGQPLDAKIYVDWSRLQFNGQLSAILSMWQEFSETHAESALIPYCLWFLSSIYNDAHIAMRKINPRDADILRSYGAELAGALSMYQTGPSYLRAFGSYIYQNLLAGKPLPYRIASLEAIKPEKKGKNGK